jgi:hypothetical protein
MSTSSNAHLVYGFDLGSDCDGWKLEGANSYGEMVGYDWINEEGFFDSNVRQRLLAAGITGVELESYGRYDCQRWLLSTHVTNVYEYGAEVIDLGLMLSMARHTSEDWDIKLEDACSVLGITPKQARPGWILCSSYR